MKGKILDFNIQTSSGVISADDNNRYNFETSQWRSSDVHPEKNVEVDFEISENNAINIYAVAQTSTNTNVPTGTAKAIYIAYLAGLLIPFVSFIGLIMAYVNKGKGPAWLDENYRFQIRTFWIAFLYFFVSAILTAIVIGWITMIVTIVWYVIRCVKGMKALDNNQAPENVDGWFF